MSNAFSHTTLERLTGSVEPTVAAIDSRNGRSIFRDRNEMRRHSEASAPEQDKASFDSSALAAMLQGIVAASSTVDGMRQTIKSYEDELYNLRQRAIENEVARGESQRQLIAAEKALRSETDRCARSDQAHQALTSRHKQLERDHELLKTSVEEFLRLINHSGQTEID